MSNERTVNDEELGRWTREFLQSDFWNLVLKPHFDRKRQEISALSRLAAVRGEDKIVYGWEWFRMALDDMEESYLKAWKEADLKGADLKPPGY